MSDRIYTDPDSGLDAINIDGVPRLLAKLPPAPERRALMARFRDRAPILPKNEWREVNRRDAFGDAYILDQKNHGSCVGFASAGALMRSRAIQGGDFVRLSGAFTYSLINGGRDAGSMISDSLETLMKVGTCTEAEAPWTAIYPNRYPPTARETAKRFRILEAYRVDDFEELMTAIQLGFIGVGAVHVGGRFARLNADGICGFDPGPGNHAVAFDGAHLLPSGEWTIDMPNSWGIVFGQRGRGYVTQAHIDNVQQDCYAMRAATFDPDDTTRPPAAV